MKKAFIASLLLLSTLFCKAQMVTIYRGGTATSPTYGSIKAAVAAALANDSLVLSADAFYENLIKIDKTLHLTGTITSTSKTFLIGQPSVFSPTKERATVISFKNSSFPSSIDTLFIKDLNITKGYYKDSLKYEGVKNGGGIFADTGTVVIVKGKTEIFNNEAAATPTTPIIGNGGAIYSLGDVIIKGETRIYSNRTSHEGGAIFSTKSVLIEENAKLYLNEGQDGGAVYCDGDVTISDSAILDNNSGRHGGGVCALGTIKLKNNAILIRNKSAKSGGGVYSENSISLSENVKLDSNSAIDNGGGIYANGVIFLKDSVSISHNTSNLGAGVYANAVAKLSQHARIDSNTATVSGGGIYINGTLQISDSAAIYSNNANTGGGIFASGSDLYLSNTSVIADNHSTDYGGGMVLLNSNLTMKDSVVIGLNTTDTNYAAGIYAKGNNDIIITGGQIIGNHSSDTDVNGLGMAIYNENASGGSSIVSIRNARIFNPDYTFKRQNEVYNLHTASAFISDTCWWGRSDTNGVIFSVPGSMMVMAGWVVADWSVNGGLPTASLTNFPVSAYFHMNTSDPLPPKMFWMLEGIFTCDSGSFLPPIAGMVAANTITSTFSIPWTNNLVKMLATVDIDTFKKSVYVAGLSIKEQAGNTKLVFLVYPNPSQGIVDISRSEQSQSKASFVLYNMMGQRIEQHELDFQNNKSTLSLNQGSGQYLVELRDEQGNVWREKIIIR
ncbi:MAG: T9SS type A sorting domain-containing protein [Chitinophagaceae bacterium]|jgi:predicted outer membrane repeat protein